MDERGRCQRNMGEGFCVPRYQRATKSLSHSAKGTSTRPGSYASCVEEGSITASESNVTKKICKRRCNISCTHSVDNKVIGSSLVTQLSEKDMVPLPNRKDLEHTFTAPSLHASLGGQHQLQTDRCYSLTLRHPLMVVATADRNLIAYNLQNPQQTIGFQNLKDGEGLA
ncbi:G-protein beta WD-40 repeat-containing protein [Artemisia annua]|uniref:G-protein beta WD-40 repeat-containing protein n=1 Tax=Artemisia annua TaxID=35608 RepID=A0A2U1L7X7_ARTAN|nr:G-protein beta WD-40 repeat-containing protein [Artemisia annua]